MCSITVCTPTYNRKKEIQHLYKSLLTQIDMDFEWIIVDDGSTDDTKEYVEQMILMNKKFHCKYIVQANHGKHVAINTGVSAAAGELFFIVDSDDWLPEDAIYKIKKIADSLPPSNKYAGLAGLKVHSDGNIVGTTFKNNYIDCTSLERGKNHINGDKAEVFFTKILHEFPFPYFDNENFLTESVVWYRIAQAGYLIRWTNEPIYFCEYLEGGLSHTTHKCSRNFEGFKLTVRENIQYKELSCFFKFKELAACGAIAKEKKQSLKHLATELQVSLPKLCFAAMAGSIVKMIRR